MTKALQSLKDKIATPMSDELADAGRPIGKPAT